ncbi:MAG: Uma2 family endonuclease [Candidatus Tectomicrobia bacterium]|uniref:Uma2 family endonuclease n=1 Tax=Tectimicrobiota bacterium TaxID=2528274 RepID=A0A932CQI5_UNCTE|nr:Uma2 family endonuclease [Candidatus Tectomicrobia bacterium]
MATKTKATIEDLYHVPEDGKAEIVHGELVTMGPTGGLPGRTGGAIYTSLRQYERQAGGYAYSDNVGFKANLPNRESFSPDAAFATEKPTMKFLEKAPLFAAEVRSEGDYGPAAEEKIAEKRSDYFAAGTLVVWDVDLLAEEVIKVYRASDPNNPTLYRRGEVAEAEPAVPGWSMAVDDLFN